MINFPILPTVLYCEPILDSFIKRPFYAISNIPYVLIGIYLIYSNRNNEKSLGKIFGLHMIMIGVFSFLYDAQVTFFTQILDLSAMFLFISFYFILNLQKLKPRVKINYPFIFILLNIINLILIIVLQGSSGRILFASVLVGAVGIEIYLIFKEKLRLVQINYFIWAIFLLAIGFGIWMLDANHIWCDSTNILNGRGVFHYLTAISIFLLYKNISKMTENNN